MYEEASTTTSDEVSRPVVPASSDASGTFKLKSGGGEARASKKRIDHANPGSGTEFAKEAVETWAGLENRGKDKSKRDWPRNVTHPATRYPFSTTSTGNPTAGESGEPVNEPP